MEGFYVEIKFRKTKCFLYCCYNTSKSNIDFYLGHLNRNIALYSSHYENFLIIGYLNLEGNNSAMLVFSDTYVLKIFIKEPTCYKNPNKSSCFDFMLTNQDSCVIETGLFDFDRMTVTIMK